MVENLKLVMIWFEAAIGLHVNAHKSKVFQVNNLPNWDAILNDWGCDMGKLPNVYLGVPFAVKYKQKSVWQPLIERCRDRLTF